MATTSVHRRVPEAARGAHNVGSAAAREHQQRQRETRFALPLLRWRWDKKANHPHVLNADVHAAILGIAHREVMRNYCGPDPRSDHEMRQSTTRWHQPGDLFNRRAIVSRAALLRVPGVRASWCRPQNNCSEKPEDSGNRSVHGRSRKRGSGNGDNSDWRDPRRSDNLRLFLRFHPLLVREQKEGTDTPHELPLR